MKSATIVIALVIVAAATGATWWIRDGRAGPAALSRVVDPAASGCSGASLTRDEAIRRAQARIGKFSSSLGFHERFSEPGARFDDDSKSWIVTFRGPDCMVKMVVDRCEREDLGGTTDCHAG